MGDVLFREIFVKQLMIFLFALYCSSSIAKEIHFIKVVDICLDAQSYIIHHYDELKDIKITLLPKLTEMIEDTKNLSREGLLEKY